MGDEDTRSLSSRAAEGGSDLAPEPGLALSALPESIGVALSGGGVRAALFSLGVLIGLVESGEHKKVTSLSSVSGGSILNAAVAQSCRFAETTVDDFHVIAKPIAEGLCRRGTFAFSRSSLTALGDIGLRGGMIVLGGAVAAGAVHAGFNAAFGPFDGVPWGLIAAFIFLLGVLALSRGLIQTEVYASFLASLPNGKRSRLQQFQQSPTTHVIIATDLVSAAPVYFSGEFVYCPPFGWGLPGRTRTASAVYSSSAFPVAFPVRRFLRDRFRFQNGVSQPPFPHLIKLTDGGVYNNLATDWFDVLERQRLEMWQFGNLTLVRPPLLVTRRIVVNAGAASRGTRKVPAFLALIRTMSVLYDNTVRPRLQTMRDNSNRNLFANVVIDISESPYRIAQRLADIDIASYPSDQRDTALQCKLRAAELVDTLGLLGETYWIEFARQTSSTKTKLTKAGAGPGARIMLHGYLSTLVAMNILHGVVLPELFKDEGYFLDLAGRLSPSERRLPALHKLSVASTAKRAGRGEGESP